MCSLAGELKLKLLIWGKLSGRTEAGREMEAGEGGKREVRRRREWLSETKAERRREGERERDKGEGVRTLGYEH